jgi:CBS domain-containing protein
MAVNPSPGLAEAASTGPTAGSISNVMTKEVTCVGPDFPAQRALMEMSKRRISCLVVTDDDSEPIGILTERDMVGFSANLKGTLGEDIPVGDLMTSPVVAALDSQSVDSVIEMAHDRRIRHVPVVDESGALVGIVSQSDFLRACAERHLDSSKG